LTTDLLAEAEKYTELGYCIIPTKDKIPAIKWTERRGIKATDEELKEWFGTKNPKFKTFGIVLDISIVAIETDGIGENIFNEKILPKLSQECRKVIRTSTRTKSPNGYHRLFRINTEDNRHGVKEITCKLDKGKEDNHNEIKILSQTKYINERGIGYEKIIDIENIQTLSKEQITEFTTTLEGFKSEVNAIRTVTTSLAPYYKQPNRDSLVFALAGFLHKNSVPEYLIKDTVEYLIDITGNYDRERQARVKVIHDTYAKDASSNEVSGYAKLLEAVDNNQGVIDDLQQVFGQLGYFVNAKQRIKTNGYNIPLEIIGQIGSDTFAVIGENPLTLYVACNSDKKLKKAIIGTPKNDYRGRSKSSSTTTKEVSDSVVKTETKTTLQYMIKDTVIDAIPVSVTVNDNPLDDTKTYDVKFMHRLSKRPFIISGTANYIVSELQNKGRYVKDRETAIQALQAILIEYEDTGIAEINNRIPYAGYFYVDNRLEAYDITQLADIPKKGTLECIDAFEEYYRRSKDKDILVTVLKWGLVSPFGFARKQMVSSGDWISGLHLCGKTQTGKSTKGKFVLALWRLLNTKYMKFNFVGYQSTEARFCTTIGRSTYPVIMNEVSGLADKNNGRMVELVKHAAENTDSRSKYSNDRRYIQELALSNIMFTSNDSPPKDAAYRLRYSPIFFERILETTDSEKMEFNLWWNANVHKFGVFGDFAAQYIMKNPTLLKELRWYELGQKIIEEFYKACDKETPIWINSLYLSDVVEDTSQVTYFDIRAFLEQSIIDSYRKDPIRLTDSDNKEIEQDPSFERKLERCISKRLIPFLHTKIDGKTDTEQIVITQNVITELQNKRISDVITMQSLADEIEGFKCKNLKLHGRQMRAIVGSRKDFETFLNCNFAEEEEDLTV
jgi:hypothetical protein